MTTIAVSKETHEKLKKLGTVSDNMDSVISMLISKYHSCDNKEKEGKK